MQGKDMNGEKTDHSSAKQHKARPRSVTGAHRTLRADSAADDVGEGAIASAK
jgi:hypothetical protein